jgi:MoaA/NifB/PqqE/SkfB family radical SAM enzyme
MIDPSIVAAITRLRKHAVERSHLIGAEGIIQTRPGRPDLRRLAALWQSRLPFNELLAALQAEATAVLPDLAFAYGSERTARALLLKLTNLALLRTEYSRRHSRLLSRPISFLVDPANACQLKCPGCIHGSPDSAAWWNKRVLSQAQFETLLRELGPTAFYCVFYNWGEPLINRRLREMVRHLRTYFMGAHVSTNLSLSFDVEALVASGLEYMIVSIDGVSQPVLEKYRRGARAELVFGNLRKLVEAKRRLNSFTPFIEWQYLMFDHNVREIQEAEDLARALGINQIRFARPYAFPDPTITTEHIPEPRTETLYYDIDEYRRGAQAMSRDLTPLIDDAFELFLAARVPDGFDGQPKAQNRCLWLYEQSVMDANGRILPCCGVPDDSSWVFGNIEDGDFFNSGMYASARALGEQTTACHTCPKVDGSYIPIHNASEHFPQYLEKIDWPGVLDLPDLQPLWN